LLAGLPAAQKISVRLDSELTVVGKPSGRAKRTGLGVLSLRRGQKETGQIQGSKARLDLVAALVGDGSVSEAGSVVLPKDGASFLKAKAARAMEVSHLLREGRELVENVERRVCAIYGLSDELTEEVVAHAVVRAGSSQSAE
jgi:hypothetical protein